MRKFYNIAYRLAVHFRESTELDEFLKGLVDLPRIRINHSTDDFILLEAETLVEFADLIDDIVRGTSCTFFTVKEVFK